MAHPDPSTPARPALKILLTAPRGFCAGVDRAIKIVEMALQKFEARAHHESGLEIVLIGHAGHPEVIGTLGQLPQGAAALVETAEDAQRLRPRDPGRLAYITQTTLSVDDTAAIIAILKARFPDIVGPRKEDICYATTNRQEAVKAIAARCDRLIVVGAPNSSNSLRLVEVAERAGCPKALLVQQAADIPWDQFDGIATLGITAGASAPELLVTQIIDTFRARFDVSLESVVTRQERIAFNVPRELREAGAA